MDKRWTSTQYGDEVGGVFSVDDLEIIPFNHWKKDMEWLVLIVDSPREGCFIAVNAYTVQEAVVVALQRYNQSGDDYE